MSGRLCSVVVITSDFDTSKSNASDNPGSNPGTTCVFAICNILSAMLLRLAWCYSSEKGLKEVPEVVERRSRSSTCDSGRLTQHGTVKASHVWFSILRVNR